MAERVTITIDVDAKTAPIGKTIAQLKALDTAANRVNSRTNRLTGSMAAQNKSLTKLNKSFDDYNKNLSNAYSRSKKFNTIARTLLFTVIGLGVEFAVTALSLVSVNAAFNIGKLAVKGYHAVMAGLAGVVAAVGVGLATAAAAMREYAAATYAFRMKSLPALGSGLNQSMAMMRSLTSDATLASFGVQALGQAFASVSKNSEFTGRSLQALRALADFAYAGGDPAKNLAAAAEFVGILQKEGKVTAQVTAAAKAMGPEFEKSFKKLAGSGKGVEDIFSLITSGKLAKEAGVFGQAGVVNTTLFGSFKATFTRIQGLFADFGQQFIEPVRKALFTVENIFKRTFFKIGPELRAFGKGPLLRFLTDGTEKILNISIGLFRKYLPLLDGFGGKVSKFAGDFMRSFRELRDSLDPLRKGGSIVIQTFGKPIMEIFKAIGRNVKSFATLAEKHKPQFLAFGESLKELVAQIFDFSAAFKEAFTEALPVINKIIDGLSVMVGLFTKILRAVANLGTFGAFAGVMGMGALAMRGRRSAQIRSGRRTATAQQMANAQLYADTDAMNIPLYNMASPRMTSILGQLGFAAPTLFAGNAGRKKSLSDNLARAKALGASRSAAYKAYAMQRMSIANIGLGLGIGELGPRIFGKEHTGAMSVGALLSTVNPVLGGAVALGGSALSARTERGGVGLGAAGGGILGGMAMMKMGAAAGAFAGPAGMLAGIAIGAFAGALIGAVSGGRAERKLAKQIGGKVKDNALQNIASALILGETGDARDLTKQFAKDARKYQGMDDTGRRKFIESLGKAKILSPEEVKAASKHLDNFGKGFDELGTQLPKAVNPMIDAFNSKITQLGSATGLTKDQIMELAHKMNVNLYDPTLKLTDAVKALGAGMVMTTKELRTALRDVLIQSTDVLDKFIARQDIQDAFSQAGEKFRTGDVSGFTQRDFAELLQTGFAYASQETDNPIQALINLQNMFGPGGSAFTAAGSPLNRPGMYNAFVATGGASLLGQTGTKARQGFGATLASQLGARFASNQGRFFTGGQQDIATISKRLGALSAEDLLKFEQLMGNFQFGGDSPFLTFLNRIKGTPFESVFSGIGMSAAGNTTSKLSSDPAVQAMQQGIFDAVKTGFDQRPEWWENAPPWWSGTPAKIASATPGAPGYRSPLGPELDPNNDGVMGDTTTSRLMRTLGTHSVFNSAVSGKRTVTSSLRNFNLGSQSSDHATGNAYDLTGQNLGAYANLINSSGGFAEFHGAAASRHLHVVPPVAPMGDRSSPVTMAPRSQGGATSGAVTVNVYGSEGQSVKELARVVIDELNKAQRSAKERR